MDASAVAHSRPDEPARILVAAPSRPDPLQAAVDSAEVNKTDGGVLLPLDGRSESRGNIYDPNIHGQVRKAMTMLGNMRENTNQNVSYGLCCGLLFWNYVSKIKFANLEQRIGGMPRLVGYSSLKTRSTHTHIFDFKAAMGIFLQPTMTQSGRCSIVRQPTSRSKQPLQPLSVI